MTSSGRPPAPPVPYPNLVGKRKTLLVGTLISVAATLIGVDLVRGLVNGPPPAARLPPPEVPAEAADPGSAAYRPTAEEWRAYLARPALAPGATMPKAEVEDQNGRRERLPRDGVVSIWAVLCGCPDCAMAGHRLQQVARETSAPLDLVYLVANRSDYVWSRMLGTFGGGARLVRDSGGTHYRRLRAPGKDYSPLPIVWGIDGKGRVRTFHRPERTEEAWLDEIRRKLSLPVELRPDSLGI